MRVANYFISLHMKNIFMMFRSIDRKAPIVVALRPSVRPSVLSVCQQDISATTGWISFKLYRIIPWVISPRYCFRFFGQTGGKCFAKMAFFCSASPIFQKLFSNFSLFRLYNFLIMSTTILENLYKTDILVW